MAVEDAVRLIKSEDTVAINGFGSLLFPEEVTSALGKRFLETGGEHCISK